jgi:manganese/zinc/iron transport system substrate-binding protein
VTSARLSLLTFLLPSLIVAACDGGGSGEGESADARIPVVTTVGMITDVATRVGGDRVRVTGLMGPGVDPHLFRASAGHVRTLSGARVIFYGGLHLEAAMGEVLEEMGDRTRTVAVTSGIPEARLLPASPDYPGQFDPHVWFDVSLWREVVGVVETSLSELDPPGAGGYRERAAALRAELDELHAWTAAELSRIPRERRVLVTAHDAFHYFGRAYDVEVRGLQGISTVTEPGTAEVQELAEFLVARGIPAIFVETSVPRRTLEAVLAAVRSRGGDVRIGGELFSDAMGAAGTPEGTYVGMVRHNVNTIVNALGGIP